LVYRSASKQSFEAKVPFFFKHLDQWWSPIWAIYHR